MTRDPCIGDVINLKLALTFYGISAPMGEELAMRYDEYCDVLMSAVFADIKQRRLAARMEPAMGKVELLQKLRDDFSAVEGMHNDNNSAW